MGRGVLVHLPVPDRFKQAHSLAHASRASLMGLFVHHRAALKWEQSYTTADSEMDEDMLFNYGHAKVIGQQGPFANTQIRAGVASRRPRKQVIYHHKTHYKIKNMFGELKD